MDNKDYFQGKTEAQLGALSLRLSNLEDVCKETNQEVKRLNNFKARVSGLSAAVSVAFTFMMHWISKKMGS